VQVFVYEFATGGGFWHLGSILPHGSLLSEGAAMSRAIVADFAACEGIEVVTTRDARLPAIESTNCSTIAITSATEELETITRLSAQADWTFLIAPETDAALLDRCQLVETNGGRLLSPGSALVEVAANKQTTADMLRRAGVPVPRGCLTADEAKILVLDSPIVVKPIDGCGSQGIRRIESPLVSLDSAESITTNWRYEEFIPGQSASVAVLCGPRASHALPACEQRISADGRFTYLGGRLPLPRDLDTRARRLALAAISVLPPTLGYVGVDMVLGLEDDGSGDRLIEVNPRLTTSYVGLRSASNTNLAAAMLAVAVGKAPRLSFRDRPIEFTADGTIFR
jgi:tyramine---L-glutamate ligase